MTHTISSITNGATVYIWEHVMFPLLGVGFALLSLPLQAQTIMGEVYGGGKNGTVSSNTTVYISSGVIGNDSLVGTPNGGIFGAGEGSSAVVSGNTTVEIAGGTFLNSIYGGGKMAPLDGNANVEIYGGVIRVNVYGGSRMADVNGYSYVYVHDVADKTTASPVLGTVYGGNDIGGEVKNSKVADDAPEFYTSLTTGDKAAATPQTFVRIGKTAEATQPYIGNVYGGSDGDYIYVASTGGYDITLDNNRYVDKGRSVITVAKKPELARTYVEFEGGTVGNIFAGGDNVAVTAAADIHMNSKSATYLHPATIPKSYLISEDATNGFLDEFEADEYTVNGDNVTFNYEVNRCFGGNNRAAMNIRPSWHLTSANINNLYSGGNKGNMTYANGILIAVEGADMRVQNVFGGCRLSDVHPTAGTISAETINGFTFPAGYAARVLIKGGKVWNVYGGNDISGQVYNGANVVIRSNIINNVYGSGNGNYVYRSNNNDKESDYYFQTNGLSGLQALKALNSHRPNTENVLVDLAGTDASHQTFIGGSVFCGGNSATLRDLTGNLEYAQAKLKIGSHVVANNVFLGSNGEHMVTEEIIKTLNDDAFNPDIELTNHDEMVEYMKGVEVAIKPSVEFDDSYEKYSTYIGSFYCGGNKGSMSAAGTFTIDFLKEVIIFDKLVAGSRDANVEYNIDSSNPLLSHSYVLGGLTSEAHPKVKLDIAGLRLEPKKITYDAEAGTFEFAWNHYQGDSATEGEMADYVGYLHGGNIYGGCYNSGYVNGDVQINISKDVTTEALSTHLTESTTINGKTYKYGWQDHRYEPFVSMLTCYGGGYGEETEIWGSTTINITDNAYILKVRGGGEQGWIGKMKRNATTGIIENSSEKYNSYYWNDSTKYYPLSKKAVEQAYDATVNLNANILRNSDNKIINNVAEIVAGGYKGIVTGNTHAIIDNGCVYTVFGGATNANIYGSTEVIIGQNGSPYITKTVYGGNDFGGQIMGTSIHETRNTTPGSIQKVKSNTYVDYYAGEVGHNTGELTKTDSLTAVFGIFGGCYGEYDYRTTRAEGNIKYMYENRSKATSQPNLLGTITIGKDSEGNDEADHWANCFVNISSKSTLPEDKVRRIYGGGQGLAGQNGVANTRQTYLLFNAANANARTEYLTQYAFGGGDCTTTWYSLFDAYSGTANHIFGACRGVNYKQEVDDTKARPSSLVKGRLNAGDATQIGQIQDLSYMGEVSTMNLYATMIAPEMEVFASGAFSGTKETYLNLYGGHVAEVYGASVQEGITYLTQVNVPEGSTLKCNAIYGGGKGYYEDTPCDTYISTINYHSDKATVEEGIYGGNRDYRFVRRVMISIKAPVKNSLGELVNVYGGGKGENTISEITYVSLDDGAQVKNVYGGSCDGLVYNKPSVIQYMLTKDYYKDQYLIGSAIDGGGTRDGSNSYCLGDCEIGGFNTWKNQKNIKDRVLFPNSGYEMTIGTLAPTRMDYAAEQYDFNTDVQIRKGAVVTENAYGGGYGKNAHSAGAAAIHLKGGTVMGNIYGGGYGGDVVDHLKIHGTTLKDESDNTVVGPMEMNNNTYVYIEGGTCTNSYGGGLNGSVKGSTNTYVGKDECSSTELLTFYDGDPTITRSIYGGGEQGEVDYTLNYGVTPNTNVAGSGTANIYMRNGHIGYTYDANATVDNLKYVMNIDYQTDADSVLYNNGNVFGGGYGENAYTINTNVSLYDGIVRNSLYGGGEIATIGRGTINTSTTPQTASVTTPGETHIYMYGGHVLRDVFGGGRGYSYNLMGNEVIGTKNSDGYVFGKTDVNIYRGEIGTSDSRSLDLGYGNVFGGGNVGYVYSGEGTKATATSGNRITGYYYKGSTDELTKDCSVLISPYTKVTASDGVTINGVKYNQCSYVSTDQLNYLLGKNNQLDSLTWEKMDYLTGVTIHNAAFAGGNVTRGDTKLYANTKTVMGNATVTLNDIYHRDLISIGTEHTGGLYGDGNLALVDGFREICVVNYGTDYYNLKQEITREQYYALNDRERAYFQLLYKCEIKYGNYTAGQRITDEVYKKMSSEEQANWTEVGFCSVYAGRLLNTIQRADFVGVHGSRIVLQGAEDRTASVADYAEYAINHVGEVSLNQKASVITSGESDTEAIHGNYFGFYNTVNFLQSLTSDVNFYSTRVTTNTSRLNDGQTKYGETTYYDYKKANKSTTWRNNGTSANKVALNSGVYLEVVDHLAADGGETIDGLTYKKGERVYGPITGVVELDIINLGDNIGGAFVYAKNIHGTPTSTTIPINQNYLSAYNSNAVTHVGMTYGTTTDNTTLETSGNFVHPTKPIVDDCYPGSANVQSPGHYWFLRGSIYLYDQYISAYTGASTAYKADVQIPLTITAGTHGRLKILNIQPSLYAYYQKDGSTKLGSDESVIVNGTTYKLNDVVSYWDWSQMTAAEQKMFVYDTYIVTESFVYTNDGGTTYAYYTKGDVMTTADYNNLPANVTIEDGTTVSKTRPVRISNSANHTNGYALTADITNPVDWDDRYILKNGTGATTDIIKKDAYEALSDDEKAKYIVGPTYKSTTKGVYGQTEYKVGDYISKEIVDDYSKIKTSGLTPTGTQATVEKAYITIGEVSYTYGGVTKNLTAGVGISETEYNAVKDAAGASNFAEAYVCTGTIEKDGNYIVTGELVSTTEYNTLKTEFGSQLSEAYICTAAGLYGGTVYNAGNENYDALDGWCNISTNDRSKFTFNYDALDLLVKNLDPTATISQYDNNTNYYSKSIELDYSAIANNDVSYTDGSSATVTIPQGTTVTRQDYEKVPNEMLYYTYIKAKESGVYIVNTDFYVGDSPYMTGDVLSADSVSALPNEQKANVTKLTFSEADKTAGTIYYYCKKAYTAGAMGTVTDKNSQVSNVAGITTATAAAEGSTTPTIAVTYGSGTEIPVGTIISQADYNDLPNLQSNFTITGTSPVETSTLYVSSDASIENLQKDRVITLIYQYQYDEQADDYQMSTITERHIVNIHLLFRGGAPSVGRLRVPGAVLPGTTVGLKQPTVTKGAYEILGGGWEIYNTESDANNHINGQPYENNKSVLYFYQTGKYVNYYAKTYLGKTYSNAVQLNVANYHSINDVMADTEHHMYIDQEVPRNCKIYIDSDLSQTDNTKNELDLLRDLYDLSVADNSPLDSRIKGCQSLDFILQDDVSPKFYTTWTPLGTSTNCFGNNGFFHGDGHVITGLDNALFGNHCGQIYNLGVRGSFTGPGIATSGNYAANCWVWNEDTTSTAGHSGNAIFGNADPNLDNCYYWEEDNATHKYTAITDKAIRKNETAFNNGEVAFDLNKFYLLKRYNDNTTAPSTLPNPYSYWAVNKSDNTLQLNQDAGWYEDNDANISVSYTDNNGASQTKKLNYVEYRYWDGDFVNADGQIHTEADERYSNGYFYPIYPDDYLFFGQKLNYGYIGGLTHVMYPHAIAKMDDHRLLLANSSSNRVYRAPAYYGSHTKNVAHFNVACVLPTKYNKELSKTTTTVTKTASELGVSITMSGTNIDTKTETLSDGKVKTTVTTIVDDVAAQTRTTTTVVTTSQPTDVYPGMTAIDFTGANDNTYEKGLSSDIFYAPITDYRTLIDFMSPDQSRNMLVYSDETNDAQGYGVLDAYLSEPTLMVTDPKYRNVPKISSSVISSVQGHLIKKDGTTSTYTTDRHHFLVDEENYHCPIAYTMGSDYRMWYQRTPCTFSSGNNGYESIVLPFTATLVSAHQKGEITHFYENDKGGHEYWLRVFKGYDSSAGKLTFERPMSGDTDITTTVTSYATSSSYTVTNDFLYYYYYYYYGSGTSGLDDNSDIYQQQYYKNARSYDNYIYLTANVPYLIAFPGKAFYEFDMSGEFQAKNVLTAIDKLELQNVSFCSDKGASIPQSPDEMKSSHDSYTYQGTFMKKDMSAMPQADQDKIRIINITGDKFDKCSNIYTNQSDPTLTYVWPFHAYLIIPGSSSVKEFGISDDAAYITDAFESDGQLVVTSHDRAIFVSNYTDEPVSVRIVNTAGQVIATLDIASGDTASHDVPSTGVYMVGDRKILVR